MTYEPRKVEYDGYGVRIPLVYFRLLYSSYNCLQVTLPFRESVPWRDVVRGLIPCYFWQAA